MPRLASRGIVFDSDPDSDPVGARPSLELPLGNLRNASVVSLMQI
jgi:hypothetical protein